MEFFFTHPEHDLQFKPRQSLSFGLLHCNSVYLHDFISLYTGILQILIKTPDYPLNPPGFDH